MKKSDLRLSLETWPYMVVEMQALVGDLQTSNPGPTTCKCEQPHILQARFPHL